MISKDYVYFWHKNIQFCIPLLEAWQPISVHIAILSTKISTSISISLETTKPYILFCFFFKVSDSTQRRHFWNCRFCRRHQTHLVHYLCNFFRFLMHGKISYARTKGTRIKRPKKKCTNNVLSGSRVSFRNYSTLNTLFLFLQGIR